MKKIISLLVALILVIGCSFLSVSAAPSPEVEGVVIIIGINDKDGNKASIELIELEKEQMKEELKPESKEETNLVQYDVKVEGAPKYPAVVSAEIKGLKTTSTAYVLVQKKDGTIQKVDVKIVADGKVEFIIEEDYEKLSVIVDKQTATSIGVSDKTGDNTMFTVLGVLSVALLAAVVSIKKIRA